MAKNANVGRRDAHLSEIVDLEPFAASMHSRRVLRQGLFQESIEFARRDPLAVIRIELIYQSEDLNRSSALQRRERQDGAVVQVFERLADFFNVTLYGVAVLLNEVPLVEQEYMPLLFSSAYPAIRAS